MRNLSTEFRTDLNKQDIKNPILYLLELSYDSSTIYLVNNFQDIISNGKTYKAFPFVFTLPSDTSTQGNAVLQISNIDRTIADFVLSVPVNTDIAVKVHILDSSKVSATDTSGIEITYNFILRNVQISRTIVQGELRYHTYLYDSFPKLRKTPSTFPGVF